MKKSSFKTLTTISGRFLKIRENHSKKQFTIKTEYANYRTHRMTKQEFIESLYMTGQDWQHFLNNGIYYKIK